MNLNNIKLSWIFLFISILIGGYIRLSPVFSVDFPINDGGMFFSMTRDLQENNFRIPLITSYNGLDIQYAYPPLGFYLAGAINSSFGWSLLEIFRILPAVISLLTIPIFYLLAGKFIKDDLQLSLSILIFSLIPASFDWLIMGGGITRSLGFLFFLLTVLFLFRTYTQYRLSNLILSGVFAGMTILSHPEHALHTAISGFVIFLFFGRNKKGLIHSIVIGFLAFLFSAPWWSFVLRNFGISPYLNASSTGYHNFQAIINFITFDFTHEIGLRSIGFLSFLGVFLLISRKQYFFPIWTGIIYITEPRSAPLFLVPAFAICSSLALIEILKILSPSYSSEKFITSQQNKDGFDGLNRFTKIAICILMVQWIISAYSIAMIEATTITLRRAESNAFTWVIKNTLPGSTFVILTGDQPFTNPTAEWFPALTNRVSINTVQGNEWNSSVDFYDFLEYSKNIQSCYYQDLKCLEYWSVENGIPFEYIYIRKPNSDLSLSEVSNIGIISNLLFSEKFDPVYDSNDVVIFQGRKGD
ncbi:ArnT family glycosyltransferase [Chloroflexota bacterium]